VEIVTRENLKTIMYAIYPKKLLQPQISQCIHLLYMTTMFESGDQIVPAYVHKKHEFTKLKEYREIWYSKNHFTCTKNARCACALMILGVHMISVF